MSEPHNQARRGLLRRIAPPVLALLVGYGVAEGAAFLAYRSITGEAFGAERERLDVEVAGPDVRAAREQAGLGMRDAAMSLHPYFGYVYTPPAPGAPAGPIAVSVDGFLDDAPAVRKRNEERLLVGIMGGSVAGQLGSWHSEALRRAILERGQIDRADVEFVRLGMPGYHQPQQLQQLTWILAQGGELDVILNVDGFNEVAVPAALNAPRGTHPLYPMNWSMVALDVPDLEVRRSIGAIAFLESERERRSLEFEGSWRSRSVIARLLWRLEDQRLARTMAEHAWSLQQFDVDEVPYFVGGPERHHDPPEGLVPFCVDLWKRSSLAMHALSVANGIRYMHFLQPNQYDPGSKGLTETELASAFDAEGPYKPVVEEGYPLLRAAGDELLAAGVEFFDLSFVFDGIEETVYADNCCHYNAIGNRILSEAIGDAMAW